MYPHAPTGDYRLLLYTPQKLIYKHYLSPDAQYACHVFTLGSSEQPRHIGWPEPAEAIYDLLPGVLVRGSLVGIRPRIDHIKLDEHTQSKTYRQGLVSSPIIFSLFLLFS
jgi:hypothetical protein